MSLVLRCFALVFLVAVAGCDQSGQTQSASIDKAQWNKLLSGDIKINAVLDDHGNRALHLAVMMGDLGKIQALLTRGANLNLTNKNGKTAVDLASHSKQPKIRNWSKQYLEPSALFLKASHAIAQRQPEKLEQIMQKDFYWYPRETVHNKSIDNTYMALSYQTYDNEPLSLLTIRYKCLECLSILKQAGYDMSRTDATGLFTPMLGAVFKGYVKFVDLLANKHTVNQANDNGLTPLLMSANRESANGGHVQARITNILLQYGADVNTQDQHGQTPLLQAVESNRQRIIRKLLEAGADACIADEDGETPLMHATWYARIEVIKQLLAHKACINAVDEDGKTALHRLADTPNPPNNGSRRRITIARLLLQHGAHINATDYDGNTPLHVAAFEGKLALTRLLLSANADVSIKNDRARTPLISAIMNHVVYGPHGRVGPLPQPELVAVLARHSDVTSQDNHGNTPLHYAAATDYDGASHRGKRARIIKVLLHEGADINAQNKDGRTPLYSAVVYQQADSVKTLLVLGADTNIAAQDGSTPLLVAVGQGNIDIVKMLLARGANVNQADDDGTTPLDVAIQSGNRQMVKLLKQQDAG